MSIASNSSTMRLLIAVALLFGGLQKCHAQDPQSAVCQDASTMDFATKELARYLFELRNNRQADCSPPDFVADPDAIICANDDCDEKVEYGFKPLEVCSQPEPAPSPTVSSTKYTVTVEFNDPCSEGELKTLNLEARAWQCQGTDILLQPAIIETIEKADMPEEYSCTVGSPLPVTEAAEDTDFTDTWEFNHALEAAVKYKLITESPTDVPSCGAYMSTSLLRGCYDESTGSIEGYAKVTYYCSGAADDEFVGYYVKGSLLKRSECPWPEFLPGSDGYNSNFTFTASTPPSPTVVPSPIATPSGDESSVPVLTPETLTCLQASGSLVVSDGAALDSKSRVWNKRFDNQLALAVVYPNAASEVEKVVKCAYEAGIKVVPRSGGHSYEGYSVQPGAITIDLSNLQATTVSEDQTTAVVQAGARLGSIYARVAADTSNTKGVVGGTCPQVGFGGLVLGGGVGNLSRKEGLACDQVLELTMIDYKGDVIIANKDQNAELLWASCGGGGGLLGIVVEFKIKLADLPPALTLMDFQVGQAPGGALEFLQAWQSDMIPAADPNLEMVVVISSGEVYGGFQYQGNEAFASEAMFDIGLSLDGNTYFESADTLSMTWLETIIAKSGYPDLNTPGQLSNSTAYGQYRPYLKLNSIFSKDGLTESVWSAMLDWATDTAEYGTFIELTAIGPKSVVAAKSNDATAFPYRDALFLVQYGAEWQDDAQSEAIIKSIEDLKTILEGDAASGPVAVGSYINYIDAGLSDALQAYYGPNLDKMVAVKSAYDEENYFTYPGAVKSVAGGNDESSSGEGSGGAGAGPLGNYEIKPVTNITASATKAFAAGQFIQLQWVISMVLIVLCFM